MKSLFTLIVMLVFFVSGCASIKDVITSREMAKDLRERIATSKDPLVKDVLEKKLDEVEVDIRDMEENPAKIDGSLLKYVNKKLGMILENFETGLREVINQDVSFASGRYGINDITVNGQEKLNTFSEEITDKLVKKFQEKFPEDKLKVFIQVVGYADSVPPSEQLEMFLRPHLCLSNSRNSVPIGEEGSTLLNRELSCLRAQSIKEYLEKRVGSNFPRDNSNLELATITSQGRGEEIPYILDPSKEEPYRKEDERRRICKIYANVFVE